MTKQNKGTKKRHSGEYIYKCLREEILTLKLKPQTQLDEISLAERFELSRSPVRNALSRLVAEGLATMLPNRTTIVTPFNIEDFPEYISALDLLQRAVTRLTAIRRSDEELANIKRINEDYTEAAKQGDYQLMFELNKQFHLTVAQAGKNPYLIEYYQKLLEEGQRLLYLQFDYIVSNIELDKLATEHQEIIEAIAQSNPQMAEDAAHNHTMLFQGRFWDYMKQNLTAQMSVII